METGCLLNLTFYSRELQSLVKTTSALVHLFNFIYNFIQYPVLRIKLFNCISCSKKWILLPKWPNTPKQHCKLVKQTERIRGFGQVPHNNVQSAPSTGFPPVLQWRRNLELIAGSPTRESFIYFISNMQHLSVYINSQKPVYSLEYSVGSYSLKSLITKQSLLVKMLSSLAATIQCDMGFPGSSVGKESACNVRDPGSTPGSGRSPGEGNGYQGSILVWRLPWTEEPGGLQSTGSLRVGHNWQTFTVTTSSCDAGTGLTGRPRTHPATF